MRQKVTHTICFRGWTGITESCGMMKINRIDPVTRREMEALRAKNAEMQKRLEQMEANEAYIAMMTDVELPEEEEDVEEV